MNAEAPMSMNCVSTSGFPRSCSSKLAKAAPAHKPRPALASVSAMAISPKKSVTCHGKPAASGSGSQTSTMPGSASSSSPSPLPCITVRESTGSPFSTHNRRPSMPSSAAPTSVHCSSAAM